MNQKEIPSCIQDGTMTLIYFGKTVLYFYHKKMVGIDTGTGLVLCFGNTTQREWNKLNKYFEFTDKSRREFVTEKNFKEIYEYYI